MTTMTAEQNNLTWYRGFIQGKTRISMAWIFAVVIGFSAKEYPSLPGILLCFAGASLRFWASGYLRKDSRPAVGGPYAFIRNPLYLGTYLMALGVSAAVNNWILLGALTVLFAAVYHFIILDEENKLKRIFKEPYLVYCKAVPRFFPRIWLPLQPANQKTLSQINPEMSHHVFSMSLAMKNKAYEAYVTFAGLIGFVSGMAFIWKWLAN